MWPSSLISTGSPWQQCQEEITAGGWVIVNRITKTVSALKNCGGSKEVLGLKWKQCQPETKSSRQRNDCDVEKNSSLRRIHSVGQFWLSNYITLGGCYGWLDYWQHPIGLGSFEDKETWCLSKPIEFQLFSEKKAVGLNLSNYAWLKVLKVWKLLRSPFLLPQFFHLSISLYVASLSVHSRQQGGSSDLTTWTQRRMLLEQAINRRS